MYIELNKDNQVMGYSEQGSAGSIYTDKPIPSFTDTQILKYESGNFIVEDSQGLIDAKAEYDANEYQRSRASEYPSIPDQLDEIYHNGIDSWKAVIKVTKDKHPKG